MNVIGIFLLVMLAFALLCGITTPNNRMCRSYLDESFMGDGFVTQSVFVVVSFLALLFFRTFIDIESVPDLRPYSLAYSRICEISLREVPLDSINDIKMPEIGFRLFMKICSYISHSFVFFLFMFGVIWLNFYYRIILDYSPYVILSIVLFALEIYSQSLYVLRQHMAMAIALFSFPYIINRDLKKFLFVIFCAFLFHQTALVLLPLFFIYNIKTPGKLIIFLFAVSIFLNFFFSIFFAYFGTNFFVGYKPYVDSMIRTNSTQMFIQIAYLLPYVYFLKNRVFDDGVNRFLFIVVCLSVLLNCFGIGFAPTSRLFMYYTMFTFLVVPVTVNFISSYSMKYVYICAVLGFNAYMSLFGSGSRSLEQVKIIFFGF